MLVVAYVRMDTGGYRIIVPSLDIMRTDADPRYCNSVIVICFVIHLFIPILRADVPEPTSTTTNAPNSREDLPANAPNFQSQIPTRNTTCSV